MHNRQVKNPEQHIGQKYGRLTVNSLRSEGPVVWANCTCECGNIKDINFNSMRQKRCISCGCFRREFTKNINLSHGRTRTRIYNCWLHMKQRCYNPNEHRFHDWGGRGIRVCDRWLESFENFLADMGECPPGLTLGRINNDGNYCPENCRWETLSQQNKNRRPFKRRNKKELQEFIQNQHEKFPEPQQLSPLHPT